MLQNRVDPAANIIKTPARGAWMGNRGIIHNEKKQVIRPFKLKTWITCLLEFKGRKEEVMAPNRYTRLFFLDEATAFSAGHRPCAECRRDDFNKFKALWISGNPEFGFNMKTLIQKIDEILQQERIGPDGSKITYEEKPESLPDGAFILYDNNPHLLFGKKMYQWSPSGYSQPLALPDSGKLLVLTPKSIINAFHAGYVPQTAV